MGHQISRTETRFLVSLAFLCLALAAIFAVTQLYQLPKLTSVASTPSLEALVKKERRRLVRSEVRQRVSPLNQMNGAAPETSQKTAPGPAVEQDKPDASDIDSMLTRAMDLVDDDLSKEALKILEEVLKADPDNEEALAELAMIHLIDLDDPQSALPYLKKAVGLNPENKIALSELIGVYDELEQTDEGISALQEMHDKFPDNSTLAMGLGQLMAMDGRSEEAIQYLERSVELGAGEPALTELVDGYLRHENYEKAIGASARRKDLIEQQIGEGRFDNQPGLAEKRRLMVSFDHIQVLARSGQKKQALAELNRIKGYLPRKEAEKLGQQILKM